MSRKPVCIDVYYGAGGTSYGAQAAGFQVAYGLDRDKYAVATFTRNHPVAFGDCRDIAQVKAREILEEPPVGVPRLWASQLGVEAAERLVDEFQPADPPAAGPIDVIDLFCGCGGLSLGFEFVGRLVPSYRLAGAVDIDPYCAGSYATNLPVQPILADLEEAVSTTRKLRQLIDCFQLRPGAPLVIIGGPPCQGFSAHRKRHRKITDRRNGLVLAFARIVAYLKPQFVVFENVPEILAKKYWHYFDSMRTVLTRSGYSIRAQIHNLAAFGVPQARFRTLIVASRRPFAMPRPFLSPEEFRTVRDAIGSLPPVRPGDLPGTDPMHICTRHRASTIAIINRVPRDGGRRPAGVGPRCLDRVDGYRDVYGRMYWDRPANTITAYARNPASGRYVHPEQNRGLTIREAALLQSFPKSFTFVGPFDHKFLQIGNAVPPVSSAYLAAHILVAARESPDDYDELDVFRPTSNSYSSGIAGRKKNSQVGHRRQ